ncbi:MAG: hypothetical protein MUP33_04965, partial [Polaromonas sp.]|nr:hypothetical protein [Polaromonas sp.]
GLKVAVTLAVIGAVVGEFVGADRGLGYLVNLARGLLDTPLLFVALLLLVVMALTLYSIVALLEYRALRWDVGTLAAGTSAVVSMRVRINVPAPVASVKP